MSFCHNFLVFIPSVSSCSRIPWAGRSLWGSAFYPLSLPLHCCVNSDQSPAEWTNTCLWVLMSGDEDVAWIHFCHPTRWLLVVTMCSSATVKIGSTLLPEASSNVTSNPFNIKMKNITKHIFYSSFAYFFFRCVPVQNVLCVKHILVVNFLCQLFAITSNSKIAKKDLFLNLKDYLIWILCAEILQSWDF